MGNRPKENRDEALPKGVALVKQGVMVKLRSVTVLAGKARKALCLKGAQEDDARHSSEGKAAG